MLADGKAPVSIQQSVPLQFIAIINELNYIWTTTVILSGT